MRVVWLFLAAFCFLTPIAAQTEPQKDAGDSVQPVLDRVAKMGLPEQQAWLKRLEERALRAADLTLLPDQATIEQKQIRSKLHQKMVSWQVLREVIQYTSTREQDAIDRLVQRYQTMIDDTFGKQPEILAKRQQAWLDVDNDWKAAGSPFDGQDRLIDWLDVAIAEAAKPQALAETKTPEEPQTVEAEEPQAAEEPETVAESKTPEEPQATESAEPQAAEEPEPIVESKTSEEPQVAEEPVEPEAVVESERVEKPQADEAVKPQATEEPATAHAPSPRPESEQHDVEPRPPADFPSTPPVIVHRSAPRATPEAPAFDAKATPLAQSKSAPANTAKALPPKTVEKKPQEVAVLDLPTETQVEPPSLFESPSVAADNPDGLPLDDELPPDSVEIKVDELAARIRGCNMGFRALEMELDEQGTWTAARLDPLVERLELLAIRRSDLNLFREAVPEAKRESLDALPTLKGVVPQVATRIVEARKLASGSSFKGTDSERKAELKHLEELSRRLAELTGQ